MSEPFIKLNMWMAETDLNPTEMIILAVIHSFTEGGGEYYGGIAGLMRWTHSSDRTVQIALKKLTAEGWIIIKKLSRGRNASVYVSNPEKISGMNPEKSSPLPRRNFGVNPEEFSPNKNNNKNNYKNTPLTPLRGGTDGKPSTRRRSRNPALNYKDATDYSREALRKKGISFGEEFYSDE